MSFSLVIFQDHCCGKADIFLILIMNSLDGNRMKKLAMRIRVQLYISLSLTSRFLLFLSCFTK